MIKFTHQISVTYTAYILVYLGHLNLQYYTSDLFWKNLRLEGQPINILEHRDASSFFSSLTDQIDKTHKKFKKQQGLTSLQLSVLQSKSLTESLQEFVQEMLELVNIREITMTGVVLGKGGWGEVKVADFRGLKVAAKCLYEIIISPHNIMKFSHEMNIASKICHPNLLQFIGATTEGNPIILTELMPTSLRKELETGGLAYHAVLNISLDVACALNYLHLFKPHPILHRDISSADVLLQGTGFGWRAKVSDYGSANLQPLIGRTTNPGNPVYSAPEAANPREHSPSMDVFSYGVLLLEMITRCIPLPEERVGLIDGIRKASFRSLVQRCLIVEYRHCPTMNDIITELNDTIY
uniref:Protein kinase domain-containing protein n=2 Tax=Amphimedon queenslandica TaxID=400682 RepID=A0A1X7SVM1_AMPQE